MGGLNLTQFAILGIVLVAVIAGVVSMLGGRSKPPN
jgi:hypothetical protein